MNRRGSVGEWTGTVSRTSTVTVGADGLKYPLPTSLKSPTNGRFVARLGKTTPDEESALLEYLQFLRSRKR